MGWSTGLRSRTMLLHLTPCEKAVWETARILDGAGSPLSRPAWVVTRALERLRQHAEGADAWPAAQARAALTALAVERALLGTPHDGAKPPRAAPHLLVHLEALADLAQRQDNERVEREARSAADALWAATAAADARRSGVDAASS